MVVISRYTPVLVWHASNEKVSYTLVDYNNNTYNFDDFFDDGYPFIEDDGRAASWRGYTETTEEPQATPRAARGHSPFPRGTERFRLGRIPRCICMTKTKEIPSSLARQWT